MSKINHKQNLSVSDSMHISHYLRITLLRKNCTNIHLVTSLAITASCANYAIHL